MPPPRLNAHRRRLLDAWTRTADAWDAVRKAIESDTGLLTWNPGEYGRDVYACFLAHYAPDAPGALLALGLNPGKYGMCQTGIPFTDVDTVKRALPAVAFDLDAPGLAPKDLQPFLKGFNRERSCRSVYGFLEQAYGSVADGWRDFYVANPCPLLFLEPDGTNVTPADARLARRGDVRALRVRVVEDALDVAKPRAVLLLGQDVARAVGPVVRDGVGEDRVLVLDHPVARGPGRRGPKWWADVVTARLEEAGLLPRNRGGSRG